uniref:Uncharacterized protein n=1 Tax=Anopheles dirus TaxID=7168 RepID=A0A182NYP3_9DIPT
MCLTGSDHYRTPHQ